MTEPTNATIKTNWLLVLLLWFAGMGAAMQFAKFSIGFSLLKSHYLASDTQIGWALSVVGLMGMLFMGLAAMLVGHWGYKRVLVWSLILGALLSFLEALLPPLSLLFVLRIFEGCVHLAIVVTAPTLMVHAAAPHQRSLVLGLWGTFFGVTFAFANALAPWCLAQFGLAGLFVIHGAWMLLIAGLIAVRLDAQLIAAVPTTFGLKAIGRMHQTIYGQWRTVLPGLLFMCYTLLFVALMTFLPQRGETPSAVKTLMPLLTLAGAFFAALLVQRGISPLKMVVGAFVSLLMAFVGLFLGDAHLVSLNAAQLVVFFVLGLQQGSVYSLVPFLAKQPEQQALSITAVAQLGCLGSMMGAPLFAGAWLRGGAHGLVGLGVFITALGLCLMVGYVMTQYRRVDSL